MCLHATIKLFQQLFTEVWKKAELKANMRPTQKQHNVCWQWDFLPNRLPKLPSYLWKSLRIWAIQKTQVSHVSSTCSRYQNTMVSPHAPGIRRASCPHTPWKELLDLQPVLKPHAKVQDSNNSCRSTREGWWFHAPPIISCSFRWISFKTAAKIQIIPQWGMNSFEKFPHWGINLIIFIPHWGIFAHCY